MVKKLLKKIFSIFSYNYEKKKIEEYLANSSDLIDLEIRIKQLDQEGVYNKLYI